MNLFVNQIDIHIAESIKEAEPYLVKLNQEQMLSSQDANGNPLIHARTGSPNLSPAYAKKKGKSKPNLFDRGLFQGQMFLEVDENKKTWFIDSFSDISKYLVEAYGKIYGIKSTETAKGYTSRFFKNRFNRLVLKK